MREVFTNMFLIFIVEVMTTKIDSLPKFIESEDRADAFVTGFGNGVLLIQRSNEPSNTLDPSIVNFIADDEGFYVIKFADHKFLCSHPQKNHIGICNTGDIKNSKWKIEKTKNHYLIKQKDQCLTAVFATKFKMRKYRLKLQKCKKNFKWKIGDVTTDQFTSNEEEDQSTIKDELAEIDDITNSADCTLKCLKDEILQIDSVCDSEKEKSNLNKHSTPFIYKDDNKYDKRIKKVHHETGLVYNDDVNYAQPDYAFGLGKNFFNVYDFLNDKIPNSTIPSRRSKGPCSAHKILKGHHEH